MKKQFKALGNKVTTFDRLETFPTPAGVTQVTCVSDEITAVCPITSQPDWYVISIQYSPNRLCVESKTVKMFFNTLRNKGIFCEALAGHIAEVFCRALEPLKIKVTVTQKPRGGVSIIAVAECSCERDALREVPGSLAWWIRHQKNQGAAYPLSPKHRKDRNKR